MWLAKERWYAYWASCMDLDWLGVQGMAGREIGCQLNVRGQELTPKYTHTQDNFNRELL